jgi:hypothetical protein
VRVKKILALEMCILLLLGSCGVLSRKTVTLSIRGRPLEVELASSKKQRARGLMNREELGWNEGMLFIFKEEQILSFWMKNTSIPLSIVFLDERGMVVDMFDMQPFSLDPVRSSRKCRYAIEANRGFFRHAGLKIGDSVDLSSVNRR